MTTAGAYDDYTEMVADVARYGDRIPSRYGDTREVLGVAWRRHASAAVRRSGMNPKIGYMELCQLIAGVYDPAAIERVAPNAQHALFTEKMAYGPRLRDQIPRVMLALRNDPGTRQAVMFVGSEGDGPSPSLPCTCTIQFLLRGGLQCVVSMRSWDLLKGLPYDLIMFGGLQQVVARCLGTGAGLLQVNAASAHIYLTDVAADKLPEPGRRVFRAHFAGATKWEDAVALAADIVAGTAPLSDAVETERGEFNGH